MNKIPLKVALPSPKLHSESTAASPAAFPQEAISLIAAAPLCFLTASHNGAALSTNHRGGSPGFLRLALPDQLSPEARESLPFSTEKPILVLPEYSGNRLYQTLGNLHETPYVGIAIPDFRNGGILYATAYARILAGGDSARLMPHTNLCVAMELLEWRLVQDGLGARFAGETSEDWEEDIDWSPYNPPVRYLAVEQRAYGLPTPPPDSSSGGMATATLVGKTDLNPDIARFAFELAPTPGSGIPKWTAGQYVVLDFNSELSQGYSHMRDDDPTSLNDDLIRTFTVSSVPNSSTFEITIRNVGRCTDFLFRANVRAGLEFPIIAFGGDFIISGGFDERSQEEAAAPAGTVGFVAGGIGITPLLAQMPGLRQVGRGVRVWWGVRAAEMAFVQKVVNGWKLEDTQATSRGSGRPSRGELDVRLFVSGLDTASSEVQQIASELEGRAVQVERQRLQQQDLSGASVRDIGVVYLCAGKAMTQAAERWLASESKTVVTESFNF
jgi:ferredoxin-NADP reductase